MVDAISRSAWVGSVQGSATHHRPRGSPAGALDPTRGAALQPPAARRASALSRQVPEASRLLVGLLPGLRMAVGFPLGPSGLSTQGVRVPVSARARCHQAQPGRAERCEREAATRGQRAGRRRSRRRATDGATRPLFADGRPGVGLSSCTRRCHRAARSRASRADSSPRASRRSACAATASASAAMAANSSSRFNAPEPPVADYPTPDASNPRRPGRPPVRRQVTAVAGAPPSHVATRGPIYATASIDTNRAAAGAGS
jgi:hypothetical protein